MKLRPYQQRVVDELGVAMRKQPRVLVQMPTGAGKTVVAGHIIERAVAKGSCVWFLAHRDALINQTERHLQRLGLNPAVFRAGVKPDYDNPLQVASVQTLHSRIKYGKSLPPKPKLVFFDECHHVAATSWMEVFDATDGAWAIGLSATPYRADGSGLGEAFGDIVRGPSPRELVDDEVLVPPEIWAPPLNEDQLVGDVVETWKELANNGRTVVFATNKNHAHVLASQFNEDETIADVIDEETPTEDRQEIIECLGTGDLRIIVNVEVLTEGFDLPNLDCVVLARRTQSEALFVQMVGRVMRSAPGKEKALLLDHGGNVLRLGHPLAERKADLGGRKKKKMEEMEEADRVKCCDKCLHLMTGNAKVCPNCGNENVPPLPVVNKRKKLKKWDGRADSLVVERMNYFRESERLEAMNGFKVWFGANRYRKRYGMMPTEDHPMWNALTQGERSTYWSRRRRRA